MAIQDTKVTQTRAGDDWDKHWAEMHGSAQLNPAQDFRRTLLLNYLRKAFPGTGQSLRLLDIGCGTGDFARSFLDAFPQAQYLGIDVSAAGIEICRRKVPGAHFEQQDLLNPSAIAQTFQGWANAAVCSEVLEHVDEPERVLTNARPYLAESALVLVTVPGGPMSAFDQHIGHRQHFTTSSLKGLLERPGFQVKHVWGAGFPFFNLYRMVVIARGHKLIDDASGTDGQMTLASRLVMRMFGVLFRFNINRSQQGWQRFAVAVAPTRSTHGTAKCGTTVTLP